MAYITNAVYNKLIKTNRPQTVQVPPELYNEINYYFGVSDVLGSYEFNMLGEHIRMCLGKNQNDSSPYLQPKQDMFIYVFETEGAYKYHLYEDCMYLNNDFNNYIIPEEVRYRGQDMVRQYRNWFTSNGFDKITGDEKEVVSRITFKYNTEFAKTHNLPILNEGYELIVSLKNSTFTLSKKYYNLVRVQNNVKKYIKDYKFHFSNRTIIDLMKFSYLVNYSKDQIEQKVAELTSDVFIKNYGHEKLIESFKIANRIKYYIIEEIKLFINFRCGFKSNNFSKQVLESYGLVCCKSCLERDLNNQKRL